MVWPTATTPLLLAAGIATLVVAFFLAPGRGFMRVANLQFASVAFFWVGYHLSPWLSYLSGDIWDSYLLLPEWIDEGLVFSLLCTWACMIGYRMRRGRHRRSLGFRFETVTPPRVRMPQVVALTVLSLVVFTAIVGGPEEIWYSSYSRGQGQFDVRDTFGRMLQILKVVGSAVFVITAMVGGVAVLQKESLESKLVGWVALLAASLKVMHGFSRGSGFALVILGALSLMMRGRRGIAFSVVCALAAIAMGSVGLYGRGKFGVGVGAYLQAASHFGELEMGGGDDRDGLQNPMDAMGPWTRKADSRRDDPIGQVDLVSQWFLNLNPLPSEIVPIPRVGPSLSVVMGTWGRVGITTPAFGELYYVFGRWGALWLLAIGYLLAFMDRLPVALPGGLGIACWGLALMSFPIGLHSGGRAMTRLLFYGMVLFWLYRWHSGRSHRRPPARGASSRAGGADLPQSRRRLAGGFR